MTDACCSSRLPPVDERNKLKRIVVGYGGRIKGYMPRWSSPASAFFSKSVLL